MRKFDYEPAPLSLPLSWGACLGEDASILLYSSGSFLDFVQRPIPPVFVLAAFLVLLAPLLGSFFQEKTPPAAGANHHRPGAR